MDMNVELVNRKDLGDLDYYQNEYGWLLELNDDQLANTVRMTNNVQNALIELFRFVDEVINLPTIVPENVLEFRNELINRLNNNANRYIGGECFGTFYPDVETFDVDEVYEIIDRVYDGMSGEPGED